MRWKYTNASVTGKAHTDRGETGQDFSRSGIIRIADTDFFIGLVADGAGSTTEGGRGATIACDTLFEQIAATLYENPDLSAISDETIGAWITAAREAIVAEAETSGKRLREYASTVLGAIAGNGHAIFFQIGDGAIVSGTAEEYQVIFWPEQGEYANTTYFITDEQFREHLHITRSESPDEIALFTDGLQTLVLSFAQKKAHAGFFRPLFEALRTDPGDASPGFSAQLETFLARDDISARSDDDKTLVLAVYVKD
jgi:hypothetical protein